MRWILNTTLLITLAVGVAVGATAEDGHAKEESSQLAQDSPLVADPADPLLGVESVNAPVYVTIIQRHKQADFYKDPKDHETYKDPYKSHHVETHINPYPFIENDKFDGGGGSYHPHKDSQFYPDKVVNDKKHDGEYEHVNTYVKSKSQVTKDTYYHDPAYEPPIYGEDYNVHKPRAVHVRKSSYGEHDSHEPHYHTKPGYTYTPEHKTHTEHKYPTAFAYLQSNYYTHTPKPKYEKETTKIIHHEPSYEVHTSHPPHSIETHHSLHKHHQIPTHPHYSIKFAPEKVSAPHHHIVTHESPGEVVHVEKAIGDVRSEFKKGSRLFDYYFTRHPPVRGEEKDLYKTTHIHESVHPSKHGYEEVHHPVKSYSVEALPPPIVPHHYRSAHYQPHHSKHFVPLDHQYYQYHQPGIHYEVGPEITYAVAPEVHYEIVPHYETHESPAHYEKAQYYPEPSHYVPAPPPLPPIVDPIYHDHYSTSIAHTSPVSKKSKTVSPKRKFKSLSNHKSPMEHKSVSIFSSLTFGKHKSDDKQEKHVNSDKIKHLPMSFTIQKHGFPRFLGPEKVKLEIREKFRSHFQPQMTYSVPPFTVPEIEEERKEGWPENAEGVTTLGSGHTLDHQKPHLPELEEMPVSDLMQTRLDEDDTERHNSDDYKVKDEEEEIAIKNSFSFQNQSTQIVELNLPNELDNVTNMGLFVSQMMTKIRQEKMQDARYNFNNTDEIIFIIVNNKTSNSPQNSQLSGASHTIRQNVEEPQIQAGDSISLSKPSKYSKTSIISAVIPIDSNSPMPQTKNLVFESSNPSDLLPEPKLLVKPTISPSSALTSDEMSPTENDSSQLLGQNSKIRFPKITTNSPLNSEPPKVETAKLVPLLLSNNQNNRWPQRDNIGTGTMKPLFSLPQTDTDDNSYYLFPNGAPILDYLVPPPMPTSDKDDSNIRELRSTPPTFNSLNNINSMITSPPVNLYSSPQAQMLPASHPMRLWNSYPIRQNPRMVLNGGHSQGNGGFFQGNRGYPQGSGGVPMAMASKSCQCDLVPRVDPRQKFSPRFVNATNFMRALMQ